MKEYTTHAELSPMLIEAFHAEGSTLEVWIRNDEGQSSSRPLTDQEARLVAKGDAIYAKDRDMAIDAVRWQWSGKDHFGYWAKA
jgi:hypothetical protein